MQIEALSIFCEVVRNQSFSQAARAHSVSQSAASQTVRQIESRLGAQLIDRSKRPWRLTPEGKIFFKGCQEIIERYSELESSVRQRQDSSGYTVRLTSIYSIPLHDLSIYLNEFKKISPDTRVKLSYMHPSEIYSHVLNDQSDLGLISYANTNRGLNAIPWKNQSMAVTCLPTHRLKNLLDTHQGVFPSDLEGEAFVAFDKRLPVRREIDRFLRKHKVNVTIASEFDSIENIKQAVEDGAGIAILPEETLRQEVDRQSLITIPFRLTEGAVPFIRPLSIIHRRKRRLNPAVNKFLRVLQGDINSYAQNVPETLDIQKNDKFTKAPETPLAKAAQAL